jgi:hypothetical protein
VRLPLSAFRFSPRDPSHAATDELAGFERTGQGEVVVRPFSVVGITFQINRIQRKRSRVAGICGNDAARTPLLEEAMREPCGNGIR